MNASIDRKTPDLAPHLKRVLVIDAVLSSTRMTADVLKDLGATRIYPETSDERALVLCKQVEPQLIVTELSGPNLDGLKFVRALRRSNLASRYAPVIVITAHATASALNAARNAGVHEFMCRPFTIRDLRRRLEAIVLLRREWIEAVAYVGPDRRRFNSGDYKGPRKRMSDSGHDGTAARIEQALRILSAAIKAIETDPMQALRSMQTQAAALATIAAATNDTVLAAGANELKLCLEAAVVSGGMSRSAIEQSAAGLLALLPTDSAGLDLPVLQVA